MSDRPDNSRHRWVTGFCWALAGIFTAALLLRVFGLEGGGFPIVQLVAFTPYVLLLSLPALLVVVLLRRWRPAGLILLTAVVLAALVLPRQFGGPESVPQGKPVRILTSNLAKGNADSKALIRLANDREADLVFLQEISAAKAAELRRSGILEKYPHRVLDVTARKGGGAIYSKWPLEAREPLTAGRQPRAVVAVPGWGRVEVVSVHPTAPIKPGTTRQWDRDYDSMPAAFSARHPLILAGDFNATLDHENLRELIATGYRDAADVTGNGFISTWPSRISRSLPVTIDHVLAEQGILFSGYEVAKVRGSDHRAIFAELMLAPEPAES